MLGTPPTDRRSARRAATQAEILDAAWAIAREEGLTALSLRDLAARVGMRAPSLYQYFTSKHAIYDAMFGQGARQALEAAGPETDAADLRAALREDAHRMFGFITSDPARAQLLFQRTIPGFEPSPESYAPAVELLERVRKRFRRYGVTNPAHVDLWTAIVSGLASQQLANDPGGDRWGRLIDHAVDMFVAYTSPTKKKGSK